MLDVQIQRIREKLPELIRAAFLTRLKMVGITEQSNLFKSFEVKTESSNETDFTLQVLFNDYAVFIDSGRRPGAKKVPISALIKFIKTIGLTPAAGMSETSLAFAIQTNIFKNGIKPRKFLSDFNADVESIIDSLIESEIKEDELGDWLVN